MDDRGTEISGPKRGGRLDMMSAYSVEALVRSAQASGTRRIQRLSFQAFDTNASTTPLNFRCSPRQTPLRRSADLPPEHIYDVLHFGNAQKKCRAKKSGSSNRNRHEQYRQLLEEPHVRPRIEPQIIGRP